MKQEMSLRALLQQSLEAEGAAYLAELAAAEAAGQAPEPSPETREACRAMTRAYTRRETGRRFPGSIAAAAALVLLAFLGITGTVLAVMQLKTISARFTEHLCVDAVVENRAGDRVPGIYTAQLMTFTPADADALLARLGESAQGWEIGDETICADTAQGGEVYLTRQHQLQYLSRNYLDWFYRYPIYYGQSSADSNVQEDQKLYTRFTEPEQLPFAASLEAEQAVREILADMGLGQLSLRRTLYVTPERMDALDEDLRQNRLSVKHNCVPQTEPWSDDQACYVFEFTPELVQLPLTAHNWKYSYYGIQNDILVWYGADGILSLTIMGTWENPELKNAPDGIITPEQAVNVVREAFLFPTEINREITRVELVYLHDREDGSWILRPAWEVTLRMQAPEGTDRDLWYYYRIDAVTGERIAG